MSNILFWISGTSNTVRYAYILDEDSYRKLVEANQISGIHQIKFLLEYV